jgi:glycosyltransferase involved in cell wall biosynthesis
VVVVPVYNEGSRFDVAAFRAFCREHESFAFLFVDDGSTDVSPGLLRDLVTACPAQVRVFRLGHNQGKAEAVRTGIVLALASGAGIVGYLDADLATPLHELIPLRAELMANDQRVVAMGSRVRIMGRSIDRHPLRHYLGRVFATFASLVLQLPIYDTQCGAKLLRATPEVRRVFAARFDTAWAFDVEWLARLLVEWRASGVPLDDDSIHARIIEVPLSRWRDIAGSKVKPRDFVASARHLLQIYLRYRRAAPLERVTPTSAGAWISPLS